MIETKVKEIPTKEQILEDAKRRLQWLTMEASDEEFDPEEVEMLVGVIKRYESQPQERPEEIEKELERFRAYVAYYNEEERLEKQGTEKAIAEKQSAEKRKVGRLLHFPGKGFLIAVAACLVLLLVAGSTFGEVNADENTGFFHWIKKDKTGTLAITSPGQSSVGMEEVVKEKYASIEEVPEGYRQYVLDKDSISLLQEYEFQGYWCEGTRTFCTINEEFVSLDKEKIINLVVTIYPDKTSIIRDTFENYDYLYNNTIGDKEQEIFVKEEEDGSFKYMIIFYEDNKKYYISGNEELEFLEKVSEEYMKLVLE